MSGIQSYVQGSKRQKEHVYAELKCGALFIYESDHLPQEECKVIIPVHNYVVSLYPEKTHQEHEIYGKSVAIRLKPKSDTVRDIPLDHHHDDIPPYFTTNNELYITCARPIDKEDWYFGLLAASNMMESPNAVHVEMMDMTHFNPAAMQALISTVQQDAEYREVQWLNAILGRLFLGLYKTEDMLQKVKRPSFLGEITVQHVDIGESIPYVTQPKLLSLTPEGDLLAEGTITYAGGLRVVIQTDFTWTYSSLMKPIRVPLVLSVMLKQMSGKLLMKIKPPPSNRYWVGFYEMPIMDWEITPIVSDKQIRLSMVSNAIQSKIREFMMENIVLPNMDDFPFCPSQGKGGIFGERVPKPSSPKLSPCSVLPSGIELDMLGNKLPPKVVITPHAQKNELLLPKLRAGSTGTLEVSLSAQTPTSRLRGYSNPASLNRPMDSDSDDSPLDTVIAKEIRRASTSSVLTTSASHHLSLPEVKYRKRRQSFEERDKLAPVSRFKEDMSTAVPEPLLHHPEADSSDSHSTMTTASSIKSKSSHNNLLAKFNNVSKLSHKPKKNALYNMAGSLFNKKKVSKEVREERNRELQESHNRKMTQLFTSEQKPSSFPPPPLPPRRSENRHSEIESLCSFSSSSGENLILCDSPSSSSSSEKELSENDGPFMPVKSTQDIMVVHDDTPLLPRYRNSIHQYHEDQHGLSL
ncbi:putative integral membrane protein conserved region-domain-containing protein [Gilbertella persicaria]|uniref:putative integral membrane protein conserved region-domain-containing protein n=1 Tax=Gilbertella persicaria TaxID=101096 RepID=UPI00221FFBCB|nr:putative integral membrane protein conserved region-domain-containing protein [Gilbertella persicaria]KAI8078188.1 putative integral membrane protein conserved region-domain-containing protein [Gilbertella persicaria]